VIRGLFCALGGIASLLGSVGAFKLKRYIPGRSTTIITVQVS
jgi:hypothetical protein